MSPYQQNYFGIQGKQEGRKLYVAKQISLKLKNPERTVKKDADYTQKLFFGIPRAIKTFDAQRGTWFLSSLSRIYRKVLRAQCVSLHTEL